MFPNNTTIVLPLNHTKVVFFHPDDTGLSAPCAVQMNMKVQDREHREDVERIYATKELEISSVIVKLVIAHLQRALPECIIIEDDDLIVSASRTRWRYGKLNFVLTWGEERIMPCEEKWCFTFAMRGKRGT